MKGREAVGGGRKFHSLAHSHQIRERGTRTTSPFRELLYPCFCFGSFPSELRMARLVGWAGQGQAPRYPANWALARLHPGPGRLPRLLPSMPFSLSGRPHPLVFEVL